MHEITSSAWVKGHLIQCFFPKKLLWERMYRKYANTKDTLNTQCFLLHQIIHCPSCHCCTKICKISRHAERVHSPAIKLLPTKLITKDRNQSWLMMAGDTRVSCTQSPPGRMISGDCFCFALQNASTGTIIINQILVVLATPCQIAGAS